MKSHMKTHAVCRRTGSSCERPDINPFPFVNDVSFHVAFNITIYSSDLCASAYKFKKSDALVIQV